MPSARLRSFPRDIRRFSRDDGQVVRSVRDVIPGDRIALRVSDGTVNADVVSVCGNEKKDKSEKENSRDGKL